MNMNREEMINLLKARDCMVTFYKKDGTTREMKCTLREDVIPEVKGTGPKRTEDTISVFDLENDGWRSFRVDSVIHIEHQAA